MSPGDPTHQHLSSRQQWGEKKYTTQQSALADKTPSGGCLDGIYPFYSRRTQRKWGRELYNEVRYLKADGRKLVLPLTHNLEDGTYRFCHPPDLVPYNNDLLYRASPTTPIIIFEGARKAHLFRWFTEYIATASMFGAKVSPHNVDWPSHLGKFPTIYAWPDNDDAGRQWLQDLAERLPTLLAIPPYGPTDSGEDYADLYLTHYQEPDLLIDTVQDYIQMAEPATDLVGG